MKKKWLFVFFLFAGAWFFLTKMVSAQESQIETQLPSEKERLQKALQRMTPESLQNAEKKSVACTIGGFLGLFGCDSEKYQNMIMPESMNVSSEGNVQGASKSAVLGEKAVEGEVKGIHIPIISDLASNILFFINGVLGGKETGGAFYFPRPDSLGELSKLQGTIKTKEIFKKTVETLLPAGADGQETFYIPPEEIIPQVIPAFPPLQGPQTETAKSVAALAKQAGNWAGVPWQIVEAMLIIEGTGYRRGEDLNNIQSGIFSYTSEELTLFQQANVKAPLYCSPNACSAAGVMQLTTTGCVPFDTCEKKLDDTTNVLCGSCKPACDYKPSAWSVYKGAVLEAANDGRTPNICNLKDSVFASAKKMKVDSGTAFGVLEDWSKETVLKVARSYYGECTSCMTKTTYACQRLGKTYCDFVWDYYQAKQSLETEVGASSLTDSSEQVNIQPYHGQYLIYYQNDPFMSLLPLPKGCFFVNAACGPMSALNALINHGFSFDPREFVYTYYPEAGCSGTGIVKGKEVLEMENRFETGWIFSDKWAAKEEVYNDIKGHTDAGWWVWAVASFYSETYQAWRGHHFLIVKAENEKIYVLDSYYGYGREIPMDQLILSPRYVAAFKFRKK